MPESLKERRARLRKERNRRRSLVKWYRAQRDRLNARIGAQNHRIRALNIGIRKTVRQLTKGKGDKAADYLLQYVGRTESPAGSNDSPFLANWRLKLGMGWMRGEPWCGFAALAAWTLGAGYPISARVVYTPNIVNDANAGNGFTRVDPYKAKKGDLVVFDFDGGGADHVGLALGPAKGGVIETVEGNTSANYGDPQSNGGGVYRKSRALHDVVAVARPK